MRSDRLAISALIVALAVVGCVGAKKGSVRNDAAESSGDTGGAVYDAAATGGSGGAAGGSTGTGGATATGGTTGTGGAGGTSPCTLDTAKVGSCTLQ